MIATAKALTLLIHGIILGALESSIATTRAEDFTIDATVGDSSEIHGAIVKQASPVTGSQALSPFLELKSLEPTAGFNTSARPAMRAISDGNTRDLRLREIPKVRHASSNYYELLVDSRPVNGQRTATLLELAIFTRESPFKDGDFAGKSDPEKYSTLVKESQLQWRLPNGRISFDARVNAFGDRGDLALLLPEELFRNTSPNTYIYLYSVFAKDTRSGPAPTEQWAIVQNPRRETIHAYAFFSHQTRRPEVHVPENGSTAVLLVLGIVSLLVVGRKRPATAGA